VSEAFALINREEGNYPTTKMIDWVGVSRSGYYAWRGRPPSAQAVRRAELAQAIRWHFEESEGTYGYRRIAAELARAGQRANRSTVASIMTELGLVAVQPRGKGPSTTIADPAAQVLPDLVNQDFTAGEPGVKLVGDITYIRTLQGWVYLAVVLDCFSKMVVGWAMAEHMRTELVTAALDMAHRNGHTHKGRTIFHSDRGAQYMSADYAALCTKIGVTRSVGRTGVCWDNAWAESWNGTLKNERVNRMAYRTRKEAMDDVASWIELRYNRKRIHSAIGYHTPYEIDSEWRDKNQAA
jgi:transposase InsO family protein